MKTDWLKLIVGQRIWSARCQKRIDSSATRYDLINLTFHKLWTAAVGTEKYDKKDWRRLSAALHKAGYLA